MSQQPIIQTDCPSLSLIARGKVREIYDLGDALLMVATDRMSAFDVVMAEPIPDKGKILNQISIFWFNVMADIAPNHLIATDVDDFPAVCKPYAGQLTGRSVLVKKTQPLPIECIVRRYISGSGWQSYQKNNQICGIDLPAGLVESDQLASPLFTPSTKADAGAHDENIDFDRAAALIGHQMAQQVKDLSLQIYQTGAQLAAEKGIIIADTKFEFGLLDNELILIDEVLTPDSSRFWPKSDYRPGGAQKSYDKQFLRDYLISINWNKQPPPPPLPQDVIEKTRAKYLEALSRLTGKPLA